MANSIFSLFGEIFVDNQAANQAIDETDERAEKTSGTFGKMGGAAKALGGFLGGALVAGAGAAVAGLGALFVAGDNMKQALNKLEQQTGATNEEMASMEDALKAIYKNGYGESFEEIADTLALAKQSTSALGEELQYLAQDALMIRDAFGIEMSESLRASETMMEQFGITGGEAMAFIAEGTQKGLNQNEELVDTIEEYSVYFKTAGLDAKDMFAVLENASAAGVRNIDFVGDAFKEMVIRTKDGSKATTEAYEALGLNAKKMQEDFAQGGEKGKQAFLTMMEALNAIEDPVEKNTIGVSLFGTKFEDLEAGAIQAMGNLTGTIEGSIDTLDKINEIKYDSFGEALKGIGRNAMMGVFEPFQAKVMPVVNEFANWMAEKMPVVEEVTNKTFTKIFEVAGQVWQFFKDNILPIFLEWYENINEFFPTIQVVAETVFGALLAVAKSLWEFFKVNLLPIFVSLYEWIQEYLPVIQSSFESVFNAIKTVINVVWEIIKDNILPILERLFSWLQSKMPTIKSIFEGVFSVAKNVISAVWDIIENFLLPVLKGLVDFISLFIPPIQTVIETVFDAIFWAVDKVVDVFEAVSSAIATAIDWLTFWDDTDPEPKDLSVNTNYTNSGKISGNATGDGYFEGGVSLVGERGPELVFLPRGTKINPANETRNKIGNNPGMVNNIKIYGSNNSARDIERTLRRLAFEFN